jgi:methyltransferase of ATP-grasp peptide maturase system
MPTAQEFRRRLADQLAAAGALHDPAWRTAVESVPREAFLGEAVYRRVDGAGTTRWEPVRRAQTDTDEWLAMACADQTWVTQVDGQDAAEATGPLPGNPTSSSSMPSVVVRMLEQLQVNDGERVLEIGTGTGYSTALMAHRLGEGNVTSVEIDAALADRSRASLQAVGCTPHLLLGDGLLGHPAGAPYDRLVATCSVRRIPSPWTEQIRPGGVILTAVCGWLLGSGLVRLTVTAPGQAEGRFLAADLAYMLARPHLPPVRTGGGHIPSPDDGHERRTHVDPEDLKADWTGMFVTQLAAPNTQYTGLVGENGTRHLFTDARTQAWALLRRAADHGWLVSQGGPQRLWDEVEATVETWHAAGRPHQSGFGLTVSLTGQRIWLGEPDGPSWALPG